MTFKVYIILYFYPWFFLMFFYAGKMIYMTSDIWMIVNYDFLVILLNFQQCQMKAYITSIAVCKSIISKNYHHCFFSQAKLLPQFTEAIFSDRISVTRNISEPFNANLVSLSELLKTSEKGQAQQSILDWVESRDVQTFATLIQLISYYSHQHQRHVISASSYAGLLRSYFSRFSLHNERAIINKIINSNINIPFILPSFVHTDNSGVLETLKLNQHNLLGLISKSRDVTIQQFMRIISPKVYNVTDLPLIHEHFFQILYPQIPQINSLFQLERVIDYLSRFQSIPAHLVKHAVIMLRKYLEGKQDHVQPDSWLALSNCIGLLIFRANTTCKQCKEFDELKRLHFKLSGENFQLGEQTVRLKDLLNESILSKTINQISESVYLKIAQYIEVLKEIKSKCDYQPALVKQTMSMQLQYLSSLSHEKVVQVVQLQLMPIIIKFSLIEAFSNVLSLASVTTFVNSQQFISFISRYPCYPHLYKELLLTFAELEVQGKRINKSGSLQREISLFKSSVNDFLNNTLKLENIDDVLKRYSPKTVFRSNFESERLWSLQGEALANKILGMRQDYSLRNILGMLKEDNQFLRSRMRYNSQEIVRSYLKESVAGRQWSAWNWDYPFYSSVKLKQASRLRASEERFFYDRFTKDTFLSAKTNQKHVDISLWKQIIRTTRLNRNRQ